MKRAFQALPTVNSERPDLFSQIIDKIAELDSITFDEVFVDGTKLEANANRYTFVWRGSIEKYLGKR